MYLRGTRHPNNSTVTVFKRIKVRLHRNVVRFLKANCISYGMPVIQPGCKRIRLSVDNIKAK